MRRRAVLRWFPLVLLAASACRATPGPAVTPLADAERPTGFPARCAPGEIAVMLLGTYHFAGSDLDAIKGTPEDVLTPARQTELADLAARLSGWKPDQVAIEWPHDFADSTHARYRRYVASGTSTSRNEVYQVAFRVARQLGHERVYPIDHPVMLGNDSIAALAARRPDLVRRSDSLMAVLRARNEEEVRQRPRLTMIEQLYRANTDEALHGGNSLGMFGAYLAGGEGGNYGGPQLLVRWYERNILMAHHLARAVRPDTRRVLLVVGSGHVPPIRNVLDESPDFCPVSPLPLLR